MLPRRQSATRRDLEDAGDAPIQKMNFLQRMFAWLFGGAAAAQTFASDNVLDSINGAAPLSSHCRASWMGTRPITGFCFVQSLLPRSF